MSAIQFSVDPWNMTNPDDVTALIETAKAEGLTDGIIVIDTLNRATPGLDENSGRDMSLVLAACSRIQEELGGLVLLIHHTGKDASKGLRGHSSLHAALDACIEVKREGDSRSLTLSKAKDGEDGLKHHFKLDLVELGTDEDGDPITSCIVSPAEAPVKATRPKTPSGKNQKLVIKALGEYIQRNGSEGIDPIPPSKYAAKLENAVQAIAPTLPCEPKRQIERTRDAITALITNNFVESKEGWLWIK